MVFIANWLAYEVYGLLLRKNVTSRKHAQAPSSDME